MLQRAGRNHGEIPADERGLPPTNRLPTTRGSVFQYPRSPTTLNAANGFAGWNNTTVMVQVTVVKMCMRMQMLVMQETAMEMMMNMHNKGRMAMMIMTTMRMAMMLLMVLMLMMLVMMVVLMVMMLVRMMRMVRVMRMRGGAKGDDGDGD